MQAPGSQSSLREANSQRILEALRTYGAITQVELAGATGLSAATVSNIVKQLEADGVLRTSATTRSGRRAQQVSLAPSSTLSFGVHITPRSLDVYLGDASHTVELARHLPLPADHRYDTTLDRVALLVGEASEEVGSDMDQVSAVGVALAPEAAGGALESCLPGWEEVDLAGTLRRRLARPVVLERRTDAAAVAEFRYGALRGSDCALYVRLGETVESCLLLSGVPHRGRTGPVGAMGHVRVDPGGAICRCGARGCLATVVSPAYLADLLRLSHGRLGLRGIVSLARQGDAGCRQVMADTGAAVGQVVADAATVLGPDRIVVGGEMVAAGELLLAPIREALRARPLLAAEPELLQAAELGADAESMGAAALARDATGHPLQLGKGA